MTEAVRTPRPRRRFRIVSPLTMLILAAVIAACFGACHALGLRDDVPALLINLQGELSAQTAGGAVYLASYLAFVVLAPILILAAGLFAVALRIMPARASTQARPCDVPDTPPEP